MKEKNIIKKIGEINSLQIDWIIAAVVLVIMSFINDIGEEIYSGMVVELILLVFVSIKFYNKYTRIEGRSQKDSESESEHIEAEHIEPETDDSWYLVNPQSIVAHIMRAHSIDVSAYFGCLRNRLMIFQIIYFIAQVVAYILNKSVDNIVMGVAGIVIPLVVGYIYKKIFQARLETRVDDGNMLLGTFFAGLISIVGYVLLTLFIFFVPLIVSGIIFVEFMPELQKPDVLVYVAYGKTAFTNIMGIVSILLMFTFAYSTSGLGLLFKKKTFAILRCVVAMVLVIMAIASTVYSIENNVVEREYAVTVNKNGVKEVYIYEDATKVEIYEEKDELQMRLTFKDGTKVKMFGNMSSCTDKWNEMYYSEYNYAADLVRKLKSTGAEYELRDEKSLKEHVKSYDSRIKAGLKELVDMYGL
ncbi:MAG: hypothetical protein K6F77_01395 [Lachnospiraceae bacterium]|nr:hypothetical protein [Lachnospiraceae bacterium]